jgi:hypothetical protein
MAVDQRECSRCHAILNIEQFRQHVVRKKGREWTSRRPECKQCESALQKLRPRAPRSRQARQIERRRAADREGRPYAASAAALRQPPKRRRTREQAQAARRRAADRAGRPYEAIEARQARIALARSTIAAQRGFEDRRSTTGETYARE